MTTTQGQPVDAAADEVEAYAVLLNDAYEEVTTRGPGVVRRRGAESVFVSLEPDGKSHLKAVRDSAKSVVTVICLEAILSQKDYPVDLRIGDTVTITWISG